MEPRRKAPTGIAQKVARDFAEGVRARGRAYFAKGRVLVRVDGPGEIAAKVRGTTSYRVRLWLRGDRLLASCTCPYFGPEGAGAPCKHIWATVLATDARGLLESAEGRPLRLLPVGPPRRQPPTGAAPPAFEPPPNGRVNGHGPGHGHGHGSGHGPGSGPGPKQGYATHGPSGHRPGPGGGQGRPQHPKGPHRKSGQGPLPTGPGPGPSGGPGAKGYVPRAGVPFAKGGKPLPKAQQGPGGKGQVPAAQNKPKKTKRRLYYIVDVPATQAQGRLVIDLARRERKPDGTRGPLRPWWHTPATAASKVDVEDLQILELLQQARDLGASASAGSGSGAGSSGGGASGSRGPAKLPGAIRRFVLAPGRQVEIIEKLCRTGRCRLRRTDGEDDPPGLRWDDGPPWQFWLDVKQDSAGKRWTWRGALHRKHGRIDLAEPLAILPGLLILGTGRAARFDDAGVPQWVSRLREEKELIFLDVEKQDTMLASILEEAKLGPGDLIEDLPLETIRSAPRPRLVARSPRRNYGVEADRVLGQLEYVYNTTAVPAQTTGNLFVSTSKGVVIHRDVPAEQAAAIRLFEVGFRESKDHLVDPGTLELPAKRLGLVVRELVAEGWQVEAEGEVIQPVGEFKLSVTSGIDWFELDGAVDFGGQSVPLPEVLAAARRGEDRITLADGSVGVLPEDWMKKYGMLVDLGTEKDGILRFGFAQASLLDALLASQPNVKVDEGFRRARKQLHEFEGVRALDAPEGFEGELRPYQREGLGWLDYLERFGFGGILADDMGLGKTIQVLALLQHRKVSEKAEGPALAVVPRSLVFNWLEEAAKFTPELRVLDYTGRGRPQMRETFDEYDLIVTTYGTVRTDAAELSKIEFDFVILDEAQSIKNATSQAAKACRLLKGKHKLAMSGTPIENHLGELWSIIEFLNPGMLGSATAFKGLTGASAGQDEGARAGLAKALKPFILRRTKSQVVKDLPEKTEQTLYCTMEPAQRRIYEELKAHYRHALLRKGSSDLNKSKIEVLEALLRLRQAACHPALINGEQYGEEPSAKLDMLLPQLAEVVDEGHKALVFSQFTTFLGLVKDALDQEGLTYEYLDGRTRNRAQRVERFQNDPDCPIFLISLKAGGLGLNLTAAEYVYLLDPWWNPAVEAQAIDRSHRIGQTHNVFAYRLICRDTVEQKIVDLQQQKRELADAILNADNRSIIKSLSRDDLEFLLS
ncbi:DEAD/DEAH box helicase [Tautonia marina]|uniref:DEAD/DEAH box helicase n=1 Tax=Tautonia marina TaxID=2653855 RepID=UPI0013758CE1|nr:DEAD/DEAH box helicase [Tautonia marina]